MTVKYDAKLRRVALADRLGKLAMELQEREEKQEQGLLYVPPAPRQWPRPRTC